MGTGPTQVVTYKPILTPCPDSHVKRMVRFNLRKINYFKFTFPSLTCESEIFEKSLSCQSQGARLQLEIQTSRHIPRRPRRFKARPHITGDGTHHGNFHDHESIWSTDTSNA